MLLSGACAYRPINPLAPIDGAEVRFSGFTASPVSDSVVGQLIAVVRDKTYLEPIEVSRNEVMANCEAAALVHLVEERITEAYVKLKAQVEEDRPSACLARIDQLLKEAKDDDAGV